MWVELILCAVCFVYSCRGTAYHSVSTGLSYCILRDLRENNINPLKCGGVIHKLNCLLMNHFFAKQ